MKDSSVDFSVLRESLTQSVNIISLLEFWFNFNHHS